MPVAGHRSRANLAAQEPDMAGEYEIIVEVWTGLDEIDIYVEVP